MGMMSEFKEFAVKGNVVTPPLLRVRHLLFSWPLKVLTL